jgi:uncharacterized protein YigE (DUF2233 family)
MLPILIASLTLLDAQAAGTSASPQPPASLLRSAGAAEERRDRHGNRFDVVRVDLAADVVEMSLSDPASRRIASLGNLLDVYKRRHQEPWFATNGGMFNPAYDPVGLYIEDGRERFPLNRAPGAGNFFMLPNGVFAVGGGRAWVLATDAFARLPGETRAALRFATQSGPMLVVDGHPHPAFRADSSHRAIRSGVGLISPTKLVFAISDTPVTFLELAELFRADYGCQQALYLDGAISRAWIPSLGHRDGGGDFGVMIAVRRRSPKPAPSSVP